MKKELLNWKNWTRQEVLEMLDLASQIKASPQDYAKTLSGKSIVGFFEKPSLRTRVSFEVGTYKLGGQFVYLDSQQNKLNNRESTADTAANLGCWADAIVARVFKHEDLIVMSENTEVPIINALCDQFHPCQGLADMLTMKESFSDFTSAHLAYIGDGNNVTHSLMILTALLGGNITVVTPVGYEVSQSILEWCTETSKSSGARINVLSDVKELKNCDVLYTDTWISMGSTSNLSDIKNTFQPYQLNMALMQQTGAQYVMHCQPAHRDVEISSELMDSNHSLLLQQAENRMHAQNAIMTKLLTEGVN